MTAALPRRGDHFLFCHASLVLIPPPLSTPERIPRGIRIAERGGVAGGGVGGVDPLSSEMECGIQKFTVTTANTKTPTELAIVSIHQIVLVTGSKYLRHDERLQKHCDSTSTTSSSSPQSLTHYIKPSVVASRPWHPLD